MNAGPQERHCSAAQGNACNLADATQPRQRAEAARADVRERAVQAAIPVERPMEPTVERRRVGTFEKHREVVRIPPLLLGPELLTDALVKRRAGQWIDHG